ncbi:MAG: Ubiquinone biosynthesis O-methyltransferase [Planctomycetes bacterium]|nr:Ubiquinone biosynthesis O-methyltransferase [Planctomycetota bacterium]
MGVRSIVRRAARFALFAGTPVAGGLALLPLRLIDLVAPGNGLSFAVARLVNRVYPTWFHLREPDAATLDDAAYLEQRRASARANMARYRVPLAAARLLEVGCGTGAKTAAYADAVGARVAVGCDVDRESIEFGMAARRPGESAPLLVLAPPYVLPFRDGAFDLVLCEEVLEHVDDPDRLVREIARVLAPGGRALLLIGPMYLHAKGPHLQTHLRVLWPHVLFSRATLERLVRSTPAGRGLLTHDKAWEVFRTLNGHGEGRYRRAIRAGGLVAAMCERTAEYPVLAAIPLLGAYFRKNLRVVLEKPASA